MGEYQSFKIQPIEHSYFIPSYVEKQQLVQKTTRQFICHKLEVGGVLINEILPGTRLTEHRSEDLKMLE